MNIPKYLLHIITKRSLQKPKRNIFVLLTSFGAFRLHIEVGNDFLLTGSFVSDPVLSCLVTGGDFRVGVRGRVGGGRFSSYTTKNTILIK